MEAIYTDDDAARAHLEKLLWPDGPVCPHCGTVDEATALQGKSHRKGLYNCRACARELWAWGGWYACLTVQEREDPAQNEHDQSDPDQYKQEGLYPENRQNCLGRKALGGFVGGKMQQYLRQQLPVCRWKTAPQHKYTQRGQQWRTQLLEGRLDRKII